VIRKALVNGLAVGIATGVLVTPLGVAAWQFWVVMLAFLTVIVNMEFA